MALGKGIPVINGFDLNSKLPLDSRAVADTMEEMNKLVTDGSVGDGQLCYCKADKKLYVLKDNAWSEVGGGGGGSQLDYLYFEAISDDEGTPSFTYTLEQYNEMIAKKPIILKIEGIYYNACANINEDTNNYEITITKSANLGPELLYANMLVTMNGVLSSSTLKTTLNIEKGDMILYSVSTNSSNNKSYIDITYQDAINGEGGNGSLMPDYTLGNNNQVMTIVNGYPEWADINMRTISLFGKHSILVPQDSADANILPCTTADNGKVLSVVNGEAQWASAGGSGSISVTFED